MQKDEDSDLQVASELMSLVLDAFAESWDTAGMIVSNQRLFRETESRPITRIVCQRHLWLYEHIAGYPGADPAY